MGETEVSVVQCRLDNNNDELGFNTQLDQTCQPALKFALMFVFVSVFFTYFTVLIPMNHVGLSVSRTPPKAKHLWTEAPRF